jgi:hypothetical protein
MSYSDKKAFEHYEDPARREPAAGKPGRRPDRALTEHVPVRFPGATIEVVRELAEKDGMTSARGSGAPSRRPRASQRALPPETQPSPRSRHTTSSSASGRTSTTLPPRSSAPIVRADVLKHDDQRDADAP